MRKKLRRLSVRARLFIALILLTLLGLGLWQRYAWWNIPPYSGPKWRQDQEASVMEAVFRYQISEHHGNQQCFLSVQNLPPNHALMQRFAGLPYVLPLSNRFQSGARGYVDQNTGLPALYFWIDGLEWTSDMEVQVKGGGGAARMSGDAGEFKLLWKHREWHVLNYETQVRF